MKKATLLNLLIPIALSALFVSLALPRCGKLLGQDELSHYYKLICLLFEQGFAQPKELITFSPHLYPLTAWGFCRLLSSCAVPAIQVTGILCWLGCIWILWRLRGWPAALLAATMPLTLQAAVTIEIDQTILPLTILLLCLAFKRCLRPINSPLSYILLALAMTAALWSRITTPIVLLPLLIGFSIFSMSNWKSIIYIITSLLAGILLFAISWWLYGKVTGIWWQGIYSYFIGSFGETTTGARGINVSHIAQSGVYLLFWGMNPFLLALLGISGWRSLKSVFTQRRLQPEQFYLAAGTWLLIGFLFVGGALFGFPKYQCPALPLLLLAIPAEDVANSKSPKRHWPLWLMAALLLVALLLCSKFMPDPLYLFRVVLRDMPQRGNGLSAVARSMFKYFSLMGCFVLAYMFFWLRGASHCNRLPYTSLLVVAAVFTNLALALRQNNAPYATGYIYGDEGETQKVAELILSNHWTRETCIIPIEVLQFLPHTPMAFVPPEPWNDLDVMCDRIEREKPACIAVSPLINGTAELQALHENERFQTLMNANYQFYPKIPHYLIWLREPLSIPSP